MNNAYGLSATTTKEIIGNKPYLLLSDGVTKLTTLDDLLGFQMTKRDDPTRTEWIDVNMVGTTLSIPAGMKYSDVIALVKADGGLHNLTDIRVGDVDGDADNVINTNVIGQMKVTWYNDGIMVPSSALEQILSDCGGPYTLKIEIPVAVNTKTKYGKPNANYYGTHSGVTYTFMPSTRKICYIKPGDMKVFSDKLGSKIKFASGYNSATWEFDTISKVHKGFKAGAGFPTTGFEKAKFSIIGSGNDQSKYRCSSPDNGGKITLSGKASSALGENCTVTYNSATKLEFITGGTPTITMQYNQTGNTWTDIGTYSISTPNKWPIGKGRLTYGNGTTLVNSTQYPSLDVCRGVPLGTTTWQQAAGQNPEDRIFRQKYMYRRDEITNSLYANPVTYPEGSSPTWVDNYFSRDVDGTFMGEWGTVNNYPGSPWTPNVWYWTVEAWSTEYQFHVHTNGVIHNITIYGNELVTLCRDD